MSQAAALETGCEIIDEAFKGLRLKDKAAVVKQLASEALRLGFSVQEIQNAVSWASQDAWWATKLVPRNFSAMMTRWDKAQGPYSTPQPSGGDTTLHAPKFVLTPGERRQAPSGNVLTVKHAEDGQVFWEEAAPEAPARLVHGWPLVKAVDA